MNIPVHVLSIGVPKRLTRVTSVHEGMHSVYTLIRVKYSECNDSLAGKRNVFDYSSVEDIDKVSFSLWFDFMSRFIH
jgi:hypothetical protein